MNKIMMRLTPKIILSLTLRIISQTIHSTKCTHHINLWYYFVTDRINCNKIMVKFCRLTSPCKAICFDNSAMPFLTVMVFLQLKELTGVWWAASLRNSPKGLCPQVKSTDRLNGRILPHMKQRCGEETKKNSFYFRSGVSFVIRLSLVSLATAVAFARKAVELSVVPTRTCMIFYSRYKFSRLYI